MVRFALTGSLFAALFLSTTPALLAAPILGTNLIVNGDAEADTGSPINKPIGPVTGWATTGNFTVTTYGGTVGFPTLTDPGPASRGKNFFSGGENNAGSSATQSVSVATESALIDAGRVAFDLSGFLGGYLNQNDNAVLTATFLSASNALLGSASIGPVDAADRGSATGLLLRDATGRLPVGTRSINFTLQMTRVEAAAPDNDGYADNLSLVLADAPLPTPTPEPLSLAVFAAGALAAGGAARRGRTPQ